MDWNDEQASFIYHHALPEPPDVETAKRILVSYLSALPLHKVESSTVLVTQVRLQLAREPGPTPPGEMSIQPDLYELRAELAAREALQLLHASGALVAIGQFTTGNGPEEQAFSVRNPRRWGGADGVRMFKPAIYHSYRLATGFQGEHVRLSDPDVYLSHIDQQRLPPRARRCIREAIDAFRHGLFLSATQNLGAASESLWLRLARAEAENVSAQELQRELAKPHQTIAKVIDLTWTALQSHRKRDVIDVVIAPTDQLLFKQHADRLRDLRNYAAHADAADDEEPRFTYAETGLLLLDSAEYINRLVRLRARVEETH